MNLYDIIYSHYEHNIQKKKVIVDLIFNYAEL